MLFHRSKEKQEDHLNETPRQVEEETVRRWRDIAAARNSNGDSSKIVVGRFEDELAHSGFEQLSLETNAPSWPEEDKHHSLNLGENQIVEDCTETEDNTHFTLGLSAIADEEVEEIQIPEIQRRTNVTSAPQRTAGSDYNLSIQEDLKQRFGSNIRSALGAGTVIEGTFRFDSPVCVEGTLSGEVYSSSVLIVGEGATINGKITVGSLIVLGDVEGSVEAEELVEIRSTGKLQADIITRRIAIEEGAKFNGNCHLQEE